MPPCARRSWRAKPGPASCCWSRRRAVGPPGEELQGVRCLRQGPPRQLSYGSAGNVSAGHLALEYLKLVTGMFIIRIPYQRHARCADRRGDGLQGFETSQWYGILAPAGTPPEVVKKLQQEPLKALRSSAVTERFASDNAVGEGGPSGEFASFIAGEQKVWQEIVKKAQIRVD